MFHKSTYVKTFLIGMLLILCVNHLVQMRRESVLSGIGSGNNKTEIMGELGGWASDYACNGSTTPALHYEDSLCKKDFAEVDAFKRCLIQPLCPGWNYVIFNASGKAQYKYAYALPLLP